jgi:hypothetical protein
MSGVDAFFSCSFASEDEEVVSFLRAVCTGLGFHLVNVSTGAAAVPPEVAREKIAAAQCLIAVCTKRSELKDGKWVMPPAVQEEMAMAFSSSTPFLMLVENGVELTGFKPSFGTYQLFDRSKLAEPAVIQSILESLVGLRDQVSSNSVGNVGLTGVFAEYIHHQIELEPEGEDYMWSYSTTKKLVFTGAARGSFPAGVWASLPGAIPTDAAPIAWELKTIASTRNIRVVAELEKHTPDCVSALLRLNPPAERGDTVEFNTYSRSRYLNPVWSDEINGQQAHLDGGSFNNYDGLIFIHKTKKAIIEFRFPRSYELRESDVRAFAGSYTSGLDYEVPSEIQRAVVRTEGFGGALNVRIEIENPLSNTFYGLAWNPKERTTPSAEGRILSDGEG